MQEHTLDEIANILDVSRTTIGRYKKRYGLVCNPEIALKKNSESHTKYTYDLNYFDQIDTMNKAYLLGFICADGFVTDSNCIGIAVARKDEDIIKFFQQELKTNKPIFQKEGEYPSTELRIQNVYLAKMIMKYGIVPNKSLVLNIEEVIAKAHLSSKQISAFLLGYFDGDGCISIAHRIDTGKEYFEMNVTGTLETITYFKNYFNGHGSITKRHSDEKNNYTLQMSNNYLTIYNALKKIYQYKDELSFYFLRKYKKFEKLEDKVRSLSDK